MFVFLFTKIDLLSGVLYNLSIQTLFNPGTAHMEHKYSAERKQHIFNAAIQLFKEKGYDSTTIRDICEAANVPVGSIYHHFKNKESFLLEHAITIGTKGHQILDDAPADADPVETLSSYYIYKASILQETGCILCQSINEKFNSLWMTNHKYNEYSGVGCLTPYLQKCLDAGTFAFKYTAEDAAWTMQALFQGCLAYWFQIEDEIDFITITKERFLPIVIDNLTRFS